jgi:hypothetical protein
MRLRSYIRNVNRPHQHSLHLSATTFVTLSFIDERQVLTVI